MKKKGFVGVDFDKTLATHRKGQESLGRPIAPMVKRVKGMLSRGTDVRIFTARPKTVHPAISEWTKKHLGKRLPVTNTKRRDMYKFYDDKAISVKPNKGRVK